MKIGEMFDKPIDRDIKGVIKVGQTEEENIFQELDEYVVTDELLKHFSDFFEVYAKGINNPTDDIGVWISGFFGSGKSHFLKILSYLLNNDLKVKNPNNPSIIRRPTDFFTEDEKIRDPIVIANMKKASEVSTDVILFNIDSKSSNSESAKDKILDVFVKVFNEMRGYCTEYPFLADFEKKLNDENKYDEFKSTFKSITDNNWVDVRDDFYFIQDEIIETITKIGFMSKDSAKNWVDKVEENYNISIEKFAEEVENYCLSKGNNHHVVFLVDEIGQYIGEDTKLMLNLQSLTEDLGTKCHGKAWMIVTSQQNIDDLVNVKGQDFSKIQGRFKTRLSLSSANVDEVIRKRVLLKNQVALDTLKSDYPNKEPILKNIFTFKDSAEMKNYKNADDFASIYPFVPYQFNLLQSVLTSIREHGASGKHLAEGERSMLALFQESAINIKNKELGILISFNNFYEPLSKFIDHTHSSVIIKANKNEHLKNFDVEVLKALFLIKYIKELKANVENITTLLINNINIDKINLRNQVEESLKRLVSETLVQKNGEIYSFLTNEEQDVNREIKNENIESGDVLSRASNIIFSDIFHLKKYSYNNRYNFSFNKAVDDRYEGKSKYDIGVRVITPYYEFENPQSGQTTFDGDYNFKNNTLKLLSSEKNEVIFYLNDTNIDLMDEIREVLQIENYLRKNSTEMKSHLKLTKQEELQDKIKRISFLLEDSLKASDIYIKGDKTDIPEKNLDDRLNDALKKLVDKVYHKLDYMGNFKPDKNDINKVLNDSSQKTFNEEHPANNALIDLDDYIKGQSSIHNKPSLKSIINKFKSEPYGFVDLDIEWLVAKLFVDKRIILSKNGENILLFDNKNEVFDYLTNSKYSEKILLSTRDEIPSRYIKSVKDVLKEIFSDNVNSDDYEYIKKEFIEQSTIKRNNIHNYLNKYEVNNKYPGREILKKFDDILFDISNKKSTNEFYKFIFDNEDELLDLSDDINPVMEFFEGNQKEIFDNALKVTNLYESNKNFINDSEIKEIVLKIQNILDMPNPFSMIKDLPELIADFENIHAKIICEEKIVPKNDINDCHEYIVSILNEDYEFSDELNSEYKNLFNQGFNNLNEKLDKSNEISVIRGISDEVYNLKQNYQNKIIEFKNKKINSGNATININPNIINMNITQILSQSNVTIKNNEDLDKLISKIKVEINKQLDNKKIINLKL